MHFLTGEPHVLTFVIDSLAFGHGQSVTLGFGEKSREGQLTLPESAFGDSSDISRWQRGS